MLSDRLVDRSLQWLKRWQRRLYFSDYGDEQFRSRWLSAPPDAPYRERIFSVLPDLEATRTVLIFKPDEIGDAVQALPAMAELRRRLPAARFFLLCHEKTQGLYERTGLFDEIAAVSATVHLLRFPRLPLAKALRQFSVRSFDLSVFLRTYPAFFSSFLKVPSRARYHPRDPRLPSRSLYQAPVPLWGDHRAHTALQLLELVAPLTGATYRLDDIRYPALRWTEDDRKALALVFPGGTPERFFVAHPFAKLETKRYPSDYWTRLFQQVHERHHVPTVVIGGREDRGFEASPGVVSAAGKLSLLQSAYLISRSAAFYGNESGPGHLAAALGVPTMTLMGGHSFPAEWAPLSVGDAHRSLVLRADVPCAPCHRRVCPGYGLACLKALTPERIAGDAERFLGDSLQSGR